MATRKSARLQNLPGTEPAEQQQAPPTVARAKKLPPAAAKQKTTQGGNGTKKSITKTSIDNGKKSQVGEGFNSATDNLSIMPPEVLNMILDNIKDPPAMNALGRSCKRFYSLMMPRLYGRIAVAAMFHAHIPKLIRTLEPLLTIKQKKQLKKEGKYKGQQENYPRGLDENATPICASYVRQLVIGAADPGHKHKYIVERYIEEALKNMPNLETVQTCEFTKSIGESIASLRNLRALEVCIDHIDNEDTETLANIKNLKHLSIHNHKYGFVASGIIHLLQRSKSTLQSLVLEMNSFSDLFNVLTKHASTNNVAIDGMHVFTALKSFTLAGLKLDETAVRSLNRSIDFMRLNELILKQLDAGKGIFFQQLTSLAIASQGTGINLRSLRLRMSDNGHRATATEGEMLFDAKCGFISSFDTLTTLVIDDYGIYAANIATDPGLSDRMLQTILKHKGLKTLRICYWGIESGKKYPYLSATTVGAIIDGLHHLQEFEFLPEKDQMNEIGSALVRGTQLTSITCFRHDNWLATSPPDEPASNILTGILKPFLDQVSPSDEKFIWENHYKLRRVSASRMAWEIASGFGKNKRGMSKPISMVSSNEERSVMCRLEKSIQYIHVGYDPEFAWVEKVDKEIV